jgi:hypothetical protein
MGSGMNNIQYQVWQWGERTWEGTNEQYNVGVWTKAKRSISNQFELANELMCMRLAHALKLPVPVGGIVKRESDGLVYFASLDCSAAAESLPPVTLADIKQIVSDAWLTCGIIVFDAWLLNEDRGPKNIIFDRATHSTYLIDHGRMPLIGALDVSASDHLARSRSSLAITYNNHCLIRSIEGLEHFDAWHARLKAIPEYFIRETVLESEEFGISRESADELSDFLLDRRERLKVLFNQEYRAVFQHWDRQIDLFTEPFAFENGDFDYCI